MSEQNFIDLIRKLIIGQNFNPKLGLVVQFILGLLEKAVGHKVYSDNIVSSELIDIYKKRLVNLSAEGVECGGFSETISSLEEGESPSSMVTIDTNEYHISLLLEDTNKLVGAIFVKQ